MKTAVVAVLISLVAVAIVFAIPVIPVPVQRIENYTETTTKQEPYTLTESQPVSTPYVVELDKNRKEFDDQNKIWTVCFKAMAPEILPQNCTCFPSYDTVGHAEQNGIPYICFADNGKIHVSWLVNRDDRGTTVADLSCPPHFGFTSYPVGDNVKYCTEKRDWEGEIEFVPNGLPPAVFGYQQEMAQALYKFKQFAVFLRFGYDCAFVGRMPPVNMTIDYVGYKTEIVDTEVTKYRDVPVQVKKQRTITDYQKISVWQRLFGK
jgi:hypothetical protein